MKLKISKIIIIYFIIQIFISCSERESRFSYYSNGQKKSELILDSNGNISQKKMYYQNGLDSLRIIYIDGDTSTCQVLAFNNNGSLQSATRNLKKELQGLRAKFGNSGHLVDLTQFIAIDTVVRFNQNWLFDIHGFVVGGMHYNLIDISEDTLVVDEDFSFKVFPVNPHYDEKFSFCNMSYNNLEDLDYEIVGFDPYSESFSHTMSDVGTHELNFIIIQEDTTLLADGSVKSDFIKTYLKKRIQVFPTKK